MNVIEIRVIFCEAGKYGGETPPRKPKQACRAGQVKQFLGTSLLVPRLRQLIAASDYPVFQSRRAKYLTSGGKAGEDPHLPSVIGPAASRGDRWLDPLRLALIPTQNRRLVATFDEPADGFEFRSIRVAAPFE